MNARKSDHQFWGEITQSFSWDDLGKNFTANNCNKKLFYSHKAMLQKITIALVMSESSNSQLCSMDVPCGINMKTLCQSHKELWYVLPSPLPGENCYYKRLPIRLWASYALCFGAQPTLHSSSWVSKRENICTNLQKGLWQCWYMSLKYTAQSPPECPQLWPQACLHDPLPTTK